MQGDMSLIFWSMWRWNGGVGVGVWLVALLLTFALPCLAQTPPPSQDEIDAIIDICVTNRPSSWATITSDWTNCNGFFNAWPDSNPPGIEQITSTGAITRLYAHDDDDDGDDGCGMAGVVEMME